MPGNQPQPGRELPCGPERVRIAHRRDRRGRTEDTDTGDLGDAPTDDIVPKPQLEPPLNITDFLVEPDDTSPLLAQGLDDHPRQPLKSRPDGTRIVLVALVAAHAHERTDPFCRQQRDLVTQHPLPSAANRRTFQS